MCVVRVGCRSAVSECLWGVDTGEAASVYVNVFEGERNRRECVCDAWLKEELACNLCLGGGWV
jgi:hypothetical protein